MMPPARSWRAQAQARVQAARAGKRGGKAPAVAPTKLAPATVREFAYDDAGRLKQVKRDGVVAMDYRYNAKGERVYRSGSGQTVHTVYDEAGHWLGDYDAAGNTLQQAIWLDDLPVGLLVGAGTNQTLYYLEPDALGSPRVAIDPARDVAVWRWDLTGEAFGNSAPNEDPDGDGITLTLDMRFPGQRYAAASELVYNYFRDYDPTTGRYVESDPIGLGGGVSTYSYAGAGPFTTFDPLGLQGGTVNSFGVTYHSADYMRGVLGTSGTEHVLRGAWQLAKLISNGGYVRASDENGDGTTYCAEIIKDKKTFGALPTWNWRAGRQIVPGMQIEPGTAIATFDKNGRYPSGDAKHAAIFIGFSSDGILVLDQWDDGRPVKYRELPWQYPASDPHARYVNSGSNFSTIIW